MGARWFSTGLILLAACHKDAVVTAPDAGAIAVRSGVQCDAVGFDHDAVFRRGSELIEKQTDRPASRERTEDLKVGIACLDRALAIAPTNWAAVWIRGKGFQQLAEPSAAIDAFKVAFKLQPSNAEVGKDLCEALLEEARFDEAADVAKVLSRGAPMDAALKANLALALLLKGQVPAAKKAIAEAVKLDAKDTINADLEKIIDEVASGKRPQPKTLHALEKWADDSGNVDRGAQLLEHALLVLGPSVEVDDVDQSKADVLDGGH